MSKKKNTARNLLLILFFVFVGGYGLFEARNLVAGPKLTVSTPLPGAILTDSLVHIEGKAVRIATIFMNGRQIFTRDDGSFSEPLLLSYGYNIIQVRATDQLGRRVEKEIPVVLQ